MKHLLLPLLLATSAFAEVTTETLSVPMRDGIKLATEIYRHAAVAKTPVILLRTPHDRTKQKGLAERFANAGYIFAAQDCRSTRASEVVMAPYNNEGQNGYDTLDRITRRPWCSDRVGMMGGSLTAKHGAVVAFQSPGGSTCRHTRDDGRTWEAEILTAPDAVNSSCRRGFPSCTSCWSNKARSSATRNTELTLLSMNRELDRKIWGRKIETRISLPIIFLPFASDSGAPIAGVWGPLVVSRFCC